MALVISKEVEMRLRDRANRDGRDPEDLADEVLSAYLSDGEAPSGPNIPYVDDDDYETLKVLIAEAEADFAAGRFKTLDQIRAIKRAQFGIEL